MSYTQFRALLQQEIAGWNPAGVLQTSVLVPSADASLAFSVERPRHHRPDAPPQLPPPASRGEPNPVEDAALRANGMNPVLP